MQAMTIVDLDSIDINTFDRCTAITFYGRSGSVFLQSLLDGHPQVLMIPGSYLYGIYDFWSVYQKLDKEKFIHKLCNYYNVFFDATQPCECTYIRLFPGIDLGFNRMGENQNDKLGISKDKFVFALNLLFDKWGYKIRKNFFIILHLAYYYALHGSFQQLQFPAVIVHQLHTPDPSRTREFFLDFPNSALIQMIRHPIQGLGSHFRNFKNIGFFLKENVFDSLNEIFFGGTIVLKELKDRHRAIKLEDLHHDPENTMRVLSKWLSLKWNDSLLESTFDGKRWWNVKDSPIVSGFNKVTTSIQHNDFFSNLDKRRIGTILKERLCFWKYDLNFSTINDDLEGKLHMPYQFENFLPWFDRTQKTHSKIVEILKSAIKNKNQLEFVRILSAEENSNCFELASPVFIQTNKHSEYFKNYKRYLIIKAPIFLKKLAFRYPKLSMLARRLGHFI